MKTDRLRSTFSLSGQATRVVRVIGAIALAFAMGGCAIVGGGRAPGGDVQILSSGVEPMQLEGQFVTAVFSSRDQNSATIVLSDLPLDDLQSGAFSNGQVICSGARSAAFW